MNDPEVTGLVNEIISDGLSLAHDADAVAEKVREHAMMRYSEPRASWFYADVINELNEREMALEDLEEA